MDKGLKDDCTAWGAWMRTGQPTGFARRGILGRMKEEGAGAGSAGGVRDYVPVKDCPERLSYINLAWLRNMDDEQRAVFFVRFVKKGGKVQKASSLGMGTTRFYLILDSAMGML